MLSGADGKEIRPHEVVYHGIIDGAGIDDVRHLLWRTLKALLLSSPSASIAEFGVTLSLVSNKRR